MSKIRAIMHPGQIIRHWAESRSYKARERAIQTFLAITDPLLAGRVVASVTGTGGPLSFVLECEGYWASPGLWRQQQRAAERRRYDDTYPLWDRNVYGSIY